MLQKNCVIFRKIDNNGFEIPVLDVNLLKLEFVLGLQDNDIFVLGAIARD
ncbi:MAG: hypothetical protein WD513_04135 [Balneolaceae bacterium]